MTWNKQATKKIWRDTGPGDVRAAILDPVEKSSRSTGKRNIIVCNNKSTTIPHIFHSELNFCGKITHYMNSL